ncbi:hypothetical protein KPL28_02875 [Clostridium algidicarnis]|uniref:hypothetical protein n=1 Tax=Clostridium algidicarnis TaxID=37659 RepID=UPI001C0DD81F|nr:hypothetical protein [Clostridium algidicarnis]MBU3208578.1 hypothetical protein [Clostridium algidicarnis]
MGQQKINEVNIVNTMNILTVKACKGFRKGEYTKTQRHKIKVYQSGTTLTAVITNTIGAKGVGVAKCNPKDKFNLEFGLRLAEYRARENFYKNLVEMHIKGC